MTDSEYVNNKSDVKIYNLDMSLIKYTKKQVEKLMIDDLIKNGKPTTRLIKFTKDILSEKEA